MSETKQYSLKEVALHNTNRSAWFVIHNEVINEEKIIISRASY